MGQENSLRESHLLAIVVYDKVQYSMLEFPNFEPQALKSSILYNVVKDNS